MFVTFAAIYTIHSINKETSKYGVYYKIEDNNGDNKDSKIDKNKESKDNQNGQNTDKKVKIQVFGIEPYYYL